MSALVPERMSSFVADRVPESVFVTESALVPDLPGAVPACPGVVPVRPGGVPV